MVLVSELQKDLRFVLSHISRGANIQSLYSHSHYITKAPLYRALYAIWAILYHLTCHLVNYIIALSSILMAISSKNRPPLPPYIYSKNLSTSHLYPNKKNEFYFCSLTKEIK